MTIDSFRGHYRYLSNFWPSPVQYESLMFPTVEHAYQAAKTLEMPLRRIISHAATPGAAKKMGQQIDLRSDWEQVKLGIMEQLVRAKFRNPMLAKALLSTKDQMLIEGNTWNDTYWGVCNGVGQNHLGKILMKVRRELNAQT